MSEQLFEVVISAVAEVRDKDGNLISSEPVEMKKVLAEQQVKEFVEGETND